MLLKLRNILFLLLFLYHGNTAFSQPDSILTLPSEKQVLALIKWYRTIIHKDSQQVVTELTAAENLFAGKNKLLQREAWVLQQLYKAEKLLFDVDRAGFMLNAAEVAADRDWPITQAECWHYAGSFYFRYNMYVPAFEYMQKAQNVFDTYGIDKYPHTLYYSDGLALCYYYFGENREAIKYLKKALLLPYGDMVLHFQDIDNVIGLCYRQLKQYDSAALWFNKSHEVAVAVNDSFYIGLSNGNLGYTYYLQNLYDKALPLLEADYIESMHAGEPGSATNAALTLAAIYIKKGQLASAKKYMDLSRAQVYDSRTIQLLKNWYENLYNLSRAQNDYSLMGLYTDSLLIYKDSVAAMRDKKAFNQAVLKLETEKRLNEVSQLEMKRKQQILLRNSLLAGLVLLAIIALLGVNRQLLKRNKEKELAEQQLHFAEHELKSYIQKLKEKNDLLEQLHQEINTETISIERTETINRLLDATILTEADWKNFRQLFEQVYPGFFIRLKEKMPDLSATDTRLLALTKLQLPPKDMASMLGVSYDAVKKARQRLRKKINLPEDGGLEELVEMI
jgi:tetratricopeptide (TPR) repeat protein